MKNNGLKEQDIENLIDDMFPTPKNNMSVEEAAKLISDIEKDCKTHLTGDKLTKEQISNTIMDSLKPKK